MTQEQLFLACISEDFGFDFYLHEYHIFGFLIVDEFMDEDVWWAILHSADKDDFLRKLQKVLWINQGVLIYPATKKWTARGNDLEVFRFAAFCGPEMKEARKRNLHVVEGYGIDAPADEEKLVFMMGTGFPVWL